MGLFSKKEPEQIFVREQQLQCAVCRYDRFWTREAQLHTAVATFFDMEWAGESAACFVCDNCGYIHWFIPRLMR